VGLVLALRADLAALGPRDLVLLGAVSAPAAVAGLLAGDVVEERLGGPLPTALLLGVAGALLGAAESRPQDGRLGDRQAALAGAAQLLALAPGVSRSGAVLTALRAARVPSAEAARFSLLMSLPITAGAALLALARADRTGLARPLGLGGPVAAVSAYATARLLEGRAHRLSSAAVAYRLGLAALVAVVAQRRKPS
jgi:undecaprenyl-diphosphatase